MALALLDRVVPRSARRIRSLLQNDGAAHRYMVHAGVGWALARLPWPVMSLLPSFDPLCRWLIVDGYGFHDGLFRWTRCGSGGRPRCLAGYALRAFDHGLGRSLWFRGAAEPDRIAALIDLFPVQRHSDLWSGAGLAATYAGGCDEWRLATLVRHADRHRPHVAQGAAFAVAARALAGNHTPHTSRACEVLTGRTPADATALVEAARSRAGEGDDAYERWRGGVRRALCS